MISPDRPDSLVGQVIGHRYRLDTLIALGGMSRVYRAMDQNLHRSVAVKVLDENYASESMVRERFESEAIIAANISHPNVVSIRDHAVSGSHVYLVMEYVRGRNLAQVIEERGRFTPRQMLSVLERICSGLRAAHLEGIVHRDMKPANVLLSDTGEIKITDFGLARAASAHTQSGTLVATLSHVSPELVSGAPSDSRSDIYAVGIMIYQMLTGQLPFPVSNPAAMMKQHLDSPMPLPSTMVPGLSEDLDELVRCCTEKDPDLRPQNAGFLLDDVVQIRSTLTDEELDLDADSLGQISDLAPLAAEAMPTTVQQRLDEWQRYREEQRQPWWLNENTLGETAASTTEDYSAVPLEEATTVISTSQATEVLDLREAQPTTVTPQLSPGDPVQPLQATNATAAYSRDDLAGFDDSALVAEKPVPPAITHGSARAQKQEQKRAAKQWRKTAQIPTHQLVNPKSAGRRSVILVVLIFIIALVVAGAWFFGRGPGTIIRIPSLTGMLQYQVVAQFDEQGVPVRVDSVYDDEIAVGRVVQSQPSTGESMMKFQGVDLLISRGPELFEIPALEGVTEANATEQLSDLGLAKVKTSQEYSSSIAKGQVISSSPAAGEMAGRKNTVTLAISRGPAPVQIPNLAGMSLERAEQALSEVGLKLKLGEQQYSSTVDQGLVADQSPRQQSVEFGSTVTVHVSKGPEYLQVPSVIGQSLAEASATLEEAGFTVSTRSVLGGFSDTVRMQTPLNQRAVRGSEVSLYAF
ncbi:protein kinase domain-containing protein [Glutamicibacter sp. AOP3-A1-12]|uniref:protein kinase domain-containing protein n=1 Tax=Glutamicibacter sp. AOP3-A1-12 TaxID=3457701 RepID=UPI00403402C8